MHTILSLCLWSRCRVNFAAKINELAIAHSEWFRFRCIYRMFAYWRHLQINTENTLERRMKTNNIYLYLLHILTHQMIQCIHWCYQQKRKCYQFVNIYIDSIHLIHLLFFSVSFSFSPLFRLFAVAIWIIYVFYVRITHGTITSISRIKVSNWKERKNSSALISIVNRVCKATT